MRVAAAILAAGKGTRFGEDKVFITLRHKPLWRYSFDTFQAHPEIDSVGIVCAPDRIEEIRNEAPSAAFVVAGGESRQQSAANACIAANDSEILLLHDAARPFVTPKVISRVIAAVQQVGAAAPAVPVIDTLRHSQSGDTVDRQELVSMQTPQGAKTEWFESAFSAARADFTDDVALLAAAGYKAKLVEGDANNFKVTTPEDMARVMALLGPKETRTGIGYDIHRFSTDPSRKCVLGGILFEDARGLEGHSDADVLLHAITDALLGAGGLGDIGQHFPNTDPEWKGKDSIYFLVTANTYLKKAGWRILNIDATLIAEVPKVMKQADAIRTRIAEALGLEQGRVSIKATTNEGLGSIGRSEGVSAFAVATLIEY